MKKLLFFFIFYLPLLIFAQQSEADFKKARQLYLNNDFKKAENLYNVISRNSIHDSLKIKAVIKRSELLRILGREFESEIILNRVITELIIKKKYHLLLAEAYDEIGELKYYISDVELAGSYFRKSLAIKIKCLKANDARLAFSLSNIGRYYNYVQETNLALIYTKKAYSILKNNPTYLQEVNPELIYCEYAYALKGNYIKGNYENRVRPIYFEALKLNRIICKKDNYWRAYIYHYLGNTYTDEVKWAKDFKEPNLKEVQKLFYLKAINYYKNAERIYKKVLPKNNPKLSMTYFVMGLLYDYKDGEPETSLKYYNEALHQIYKMKYDEITPYINIKDIYNLHHVMSIVSYKIKAEHKLYQNGFKDYSKLVLQSSDYLNQIYIQILRKYTLNTNSDITTYYFSPPYEEALDVCYNEYKKTDSLYFLNKTLNYIEDSKYLSFKYLKVSNVKELTIKSVQSKTGEKNAILIFYDGKKHSYQLFVNSNSVTFNRKTIDENIILKAENFVKNMDKTSALAYKIKANTFYNLFLKYNIPEETEKLTIIPGSTYTCLIPFEALTTNTKGNSFKNLNYVLNKYVVSYSLSLSIKQQQETSSSANKNTFIGIAPNNKQFSKLPFSGKLVKQLNSTYNNEVDVELSKGNYSSHFTDFTVIHLATHSFKSENPDSSYLVFTNKKVYLPQIHQLNLTCNLLNLQACETGLGKSIQQNGGLINFIRAFSYAGVKSITSTLWKVDDQSSSEIFENFYSYLQTHTKDDALTSAKKAYLKNANDQTANPFYWGGVVLYGNTNKINLEKRNYNLYYVFGGIFLGLIILFLAIYIHK